jgi:uncharacterized protein YndB with AHSA1/START domain
MISYSSIVTINRPASEVYAALLDPERYGQWTEMVDMRLDTPGEPAVGSRGQFRLAKGPIKGMLTYTISELEPDRLVVFDIEHPTLTWHAVSRLEPAGDGTRLDYSGEIRLRGWRRLLEPLMAAEVKAGEGKEALVLKALLEESAQT